MADAKRPFTAFLIAGEESGDQLGAGLMREMTRELGEVRFEGVGGRRMSRHGLKSLFPMEDIGHHGITAVIANAHRILTRMHEAARAVVAADPDVLVIIDCPGFNLGVARRVRKWKPSIAIVEYVSPTVWVWRPGRARWISGFVDHVMAILPFEPAVHRRLGGPRCTYVGHPLMERLAILMPAEGERRPLGSGERPVLLVLPGSRTTEVRRLTQSFGEAVARLVRDAGDMEVILPAVPRFAAEIRERSANWPVKPVIIEGEEEKFRAFRRANLALAASGTVTLELALSGVPMVVAYRVDMLAKPFKWVLSRINSFVMPNLILGTNEIPEFLDNEASPENLAAALLPLLHDGPDRSRQIEAFQRLHEAMSLETGTPSGHAAALVIEEATARQPKLLEPAK